MHRGSPLCLQVYRISAASSSRSKPSKGVGGVGNSGSWARGRTSQSISCHAPLVEGNAGKPPGGGKIKALQESQRRIVGQGHRGTCMHKALNRQHPHEPQHQRGPQTLPVKCLGAIDTYFRIPLVGGIVPQGSGKGATHHLIVDFRYQVGIGGGQAANFPEDASGVGGLGGIFFRIRAAELRQGGSVAFANGAENIPYVSFSFALSIYSSSRVMARMSLSSTVI